jgi:hypothetical protein
VPARAAEVQREVSWVGVPRAGGALEGEVRPAGPSAAFEHLVVSNPASQPRTVKLLTIDAPGVTRSRYAIAGEVRYEGVEGTAYLEMWSAIAGQGSFFTRTLASSGPMKSLTGSAAWRPFILPFDATGAPPPRSLEVNLVLPGRGTVALGPLRLLQFAEGENPLASAGAWWGPRAAGLGGGVTGSLIGCLGALVGLLAQRGQGRALALGLLKGMLALGVAGTALGAVALARAQPYEVVYPLLLEGVLCGVLGATLLPRLRRRYEELELRKMRALDLPSRA